MCVMSRRALVRRMRGCKLSLTQVYFEITKKEIYKTLLCYSRFGSNFQLSAAVSPPLASLLNKSWSPASDII